MGTLETTAQYQRRKGYLQHTVLTVVGVTGILLVTMAAPNTLQLLDKLGWMKKRLGEQVRSALTRLARNDLIVFEERNGKRYARITEKGKRALAFERQKITLQTFRSKRWDKRFRIVMFDVSEKRRAIRVRLREIMRASGFLRLQDSVWVYPYDCEDFVALLKTDLRLGKEVLYTIVESIENDAWVRKHFGLPVK